MSGHEEMWERKGELGLMGELDAVVVD